MLRDVQVSTLRNLTLAGLFVLCALVARPVCAQEASRFEVTAGYSRLDAEGLPTLSGDLGSRRPIGTHQKGFDAAFSWYFTKHFGFTADVSGHYDGSGVYSDDIRSPRLSATYVVRATTRTHFVLGGPTARFQAGRLTLTGRALFGTAFRREDRSYLFTSIVTDVVDPGLSPFVGRVRSSSRFASGVGGAVDLNVVRHVDVRLFQVDYLHANYGDDGERNIRYAAGVVFRF